MSDVKSWLEEKRSAYLYNVIARQETDKAKKKMFNELALSAEKQSEMWKHQIEQAGKQTPLYRPDFRTRFIGFLLRHFTIKQLRIILAAMKVRGMSVYDSILINNHMLTHGAKYEKKHKGLNAAGNLRAAVFGVNDGLVSNASLLLGLVGGGANSHTLVLTGIAGLLAGACSMAAGEYVSMLSQREFFEYQIALEKEELALYPQEEAAELAVIYEARGLDKSEAQK
ncbi:MAG TPA: VIT1/CCC1 transporter family protein, partial [Gammaproteobacteria bacterium]|nr:VIT1/CCC1 transporter family protein [Gammaproteobacteria bacterium]